MRDIEPQLTFADLEFMSHGVRMNPVLQQISDLLDKNKELVETVRQQLNRGLKKPNTGRNGLTAEQVLRSLILMRVKDWDYRELSERIADGYTLRQFTHFQASRVPKHDAFNRGHNRLSASTVQAVNDLVIRFAVKAGLEDGSKLRVDTMVVETNIHWPTDATLLWDSIRVLIRLTRRLRQISPNGAPRIVNRKRAARKLMQKLQRMTATQRQTQQLPAYRELLAIAQQVLENALLVVKAIESVPGQTLANVRAIETLRTEITNHCQLGERAVHQARRRVIDGEQVPSSDKIYSIFEPHTALIKRGKTNKPIEFGHKVFLAESGSGLITEYRVLDGNPHDEGHVQGSLRRHRQVFAAAPKLYAGDRNFQSETNETACKDAGVANVCTPQRGGKKTADRQAREQSLEFKKGQAFRAGIEGTISVLMRGRGMRRCLTHGKERFELLVAAAVLANNLMRIAQLLLNTKKKSRSIAA